MDIIIPKCTVDISGLQAAIKERVKYPGRTEAEVVNNAAFWVAYNTREAMPFSPIGRIDAELGVAVNLTKIKSGKRFSRNKKKFTFTAGKSGDIVTSVPLAALIINARANPNSNYNKITNSRYAGPSPFKGLSRSAGAAAMAGAISRMIKSRHSSIKFLRLGWAMALQALWRFKGGIPAKRDFSTKGDYSQFGQVIIAQEGGTKVMAMISNDIGVEGSVNAPNYNAAMLRYGVPALQAAINREERQMLAYMIEKTKKLNDKFNAMAR